MRSLKIKEIVEATSGRLLRGDPEEEILNISTDSREVLEQALFIPIIGEKFDGHDFMASAFENGYKSFLIDASHEYLEEDVNLIEVEDTTKAYGDIAKYYQEKFTLEKIGITGSVGKTSTKDIIASVVSMKYKTLKNLGNLNNEIGLPKTLLNLDETYEAAVLEMGMSFAHEIEHLAFVYRPKIAVITNIGLSHIENFASQDEIFKAKMEITAYFDASNILIINGDDPYLKTLKNSSKPYQIFSYGFASDNDFCCSSYEILEDYSTFKVVINGQEEEFKIPSNAKHNILNSMAAIIVGLLLDIPLAKIKEGLEHFKITKGRLTILKKKDLTIIDDSYNASLDSTLAALEVLSNYKTRRVAILGDVLETGSHAEEIHRGIGSGVVSKADVLITVGKDARFILDEALNCGFLKENTRHYKDVEDLLKDVLDIVRDDDTVLVKASRGIMLDRVVELLDKSYED